MRPFSAMSAVFLIACAVSAPGQANGPPSPGAVAQPPAPGCNCPRVQPRRTWRPHRHARVHWKHSRPVRIAAAPPPYWPAAYDPPIPSPYDSAYDRGMFLHLRSPVVSGNYLLEPGYPATPPIRGVQHYRVQTGGAVFQYDGLIGEYIRLAQSDAHRIGPVAAVPALPGPVPR